MAHDLVLGQTRRSFALGALPPGATGYAPTRWISPEEAESLVAALASRSGIFTPPLPRAAAEARVLEHLRAKKIGITSPVTGVGLDLGVLVVNRLRGRPDNAPLLDAGVPPLTPAVPLTASQKTLEKRALSLLEPTTAAHAAALLLWARARGMRATLGETYRSLADQMALPENRTGIERGKIGWHQVGRAFHIVVRDERGQVDRSAYRPLGDEAERRGGVWLGRKPLQTPAGLVNDLAHFEYHPGLTIGRYRGTALAARELASAERRAARYA
jgi:hypothetical protein